MRLCLEVWGSDYAQIRAQARHAEALGYHGFYYGESLTDLDLDCWSVLAALAEATTHIELGPVITSTLPAYRSVALLAKQACTLQRISRGRLAFRTGCGGGRRRAAAWWVPYGIPYPRASERFEMLQEGLEALEQWWSTGSCTLHGRELRIEDAALERPEIPIPVTLAARRPRMLALAARRAHVWEASYLDPAEFTERSRLFGCEPGAERVRRSLEVDCFIAPTDDAFQALEARVHRERGEYASAVLRRSLHGTPERVAAQILAYSEAGVQQLVLAFADALACEPLEWLLEAAQRAGVLNQARMSSDG